MCRASDASPRKRATLKGLIRGDRICREDYGNATARGLGLLTSKRERLGKASESPVTVASNERHQEVKSRDLSLFRKLFEFESTFGRGPILYKGAKRRKGPQNEFSRGHIQ